MVQWLGDNAEPIGQRHGREGPARGLTPEEGLKYEFRLAGPIRNETALAQLSRVLFVKCCHGMTTW